MNRNGFFLVFGTLCAVAVSVWPLTAQATLVTAAGTVIQNTIPGGGIGTSGYVFFDAKTPPSSGSAFPDASPTDIVLLPGFVSSISDAAGVAGRYHAPTGTYSQLTIASTLYDTGLIVRTSDGDLVTITLANSGLPSGGFQLGLLGTNYNYNGVGHPSVSLTVTSTLLGGSADTQSVTQVGGDFPANRFYLFNVTNLTPGDVLTISGVQGIDGLLLGGIAFNLVPEPSSFALITFGLLGMLRFRKQHSSTC